MKRIDLSRTVATRLTGLIFWIVALAVLASAGCGTTQYEQRMDQRMSELRQSPQPEERNPSANQRADSFDDQ